MPKLINVHKSICTVITLNRPEVRNALNDKLIIELTQTLKKIDRDKLIRVVCLQGAGDYFCAGADLNWMQQSLNYSRTQNIKDAKGFSDLLATLHQLSKPTVAVVQGGAAGGAIGLMACCDIVIAETKAEFKFSETRVGLIPAIISPYIMHAIGERQTKRYFLTAEHFSAGDAKDLGLVHHVVDKKSLQRCKEEVLEHLLLNGPQALSKVKKLFSPVEQQRKTKLIKMLADIRTSKEGQAGLNAFLNKRKPYWQI